MTPRSSRTNSRRGLYSAFNVILSDDADAQTFNDFELEAHMECTYDRLEIFDGDNTSDRQLGRLCGSGLPNPIVSTGNQLYMTFYTDASVQRKGFDITHTTGTPQCPSVYFR